MTDKLKTVTQIPQKNYFKVAEMPQSNNIIFNDTSLQCRICLQQTQQNQVSDICKCRGNISVSHKECLIQWVKKSKQQRSYLSDYYSVCDICKSPINLKTQVILKCINFKDFALVKQQSQCTVVVLIVFLIGVVILGLSLYGMYHNEKDENLRKLLKIGFILSLVILGLDLVFYLVHVFTILQIQVIGFKSFQQIKIETRRKQQVIPIVEWESKNQNQNSIANLHELIPE